MIPTSCVEHGPFKSLHSWKLDVPGIRDAADSGNEDRSAAHKFNLCLEILEAHIPLLGLFVPVRAQALDRELHVLSQVKLIDGGFHVLQDLGAVAQLLGPIWVEVEGKRVQNCRHVAANTWIRVCAPCPAHSVELLINGEIGEPQLVLHRMRHRNTRRSSADNNYVGRRHPAWMGRQKTKGDEGT